MLHYLINLLTAVFSLFAFDFLMRTLDKNDAIAPTTGKEYFLVAAVTVITTLQNSSTSLLLFCSIGYIFYAAHTDKCCSMVYSLPSILLIVFGAIHFLLTVGLSVTAVVLLFIPIAATILITLFRVISGGDLEVIIALILCMYTFSDNVVAPYIFMMFVACLLSSICNLKKYIVLKKKKNPFVPYLLIGYVTTIFLYGI